MQHPPKHLQSILWSVDTNHLDIEKDKPYIIHQILAYGQLTDFKWLFKTYPIDNIIYTFTNYPYKDYRAARFFLVKDLLLSLNDIKLDPRVYVKNIPRRIE